jgi:ribonuclease Z
LHSVPSCGWTIRLADTAGRFEREKASEMNLDSEQKRNLAAGENVENNGELLKAEDFRGLPRDAPCVLISGDTGAGVPSFSKIEVGPTLLIHEATYTSERVDRARQWLHSTSQDAANAAIEMSAKHLLLTHYSSRIEDTSQLLAEAREIHPSTAAAVDGDIVKMDLEGGISHLRYDGRGWSQLHDSF